MVTKALANITTSEIMNEKDRQSAEAEMRRTKIRAKQISLRVHNMKKDVAAQAALGNKNAAPDALNELIGLSQELLNLGQGSRSTVVDLKTELDNLTKEAERQATKAKEGEE